VLTVVAALLPHLVWAGVAVYAVTRVSAVLEAWEPTPPVAPPPADGIVIPEDLVALAMSHRESWAQEDMLRVIREQYDDLKDWNRVRATMNVGRMDG